MKKHVIGLTGFAGVGKDTVADLLVAHFGFRKLAFADALRGEVAEAFGIDIGFLSNPHTKHHPLSALAMRRAPSAFLAAVCFAGGEGTDRGGVDHHWLDQPRTPRQILQWWGTEYRRSQHPHYWSRIMLQRLVDYMRDGAMRLVITDCRFQNEADTVRTVGGLLWQVKRPGIDAASTTEGAHVSATDGAVFKPDTVITNNHAQEHLQGVVLSEFVALETGVRGAKVTVPT